MEVDASAGETVSVALQASPEGEVHLQISPSQGPRQRHASGPWATQQHHRGDLSFLDPVNMADCPPTVSACCSCAGCRPGALRWLPSTCLCRPTACQGPSVACIGGLGIVLHKLRKLHHWAASWLLEVLEARCPGAICYQCRGLVQS